MDFTDFQAEALKTESRPTALSVNPQLLVCALDAQIQLSVLLNLVKKAAFFGKPVDVKVFESECIRLVTTIAVMGANHEFINDPDHDLGLRFRENADPEDASSIPTANKFNLRLLHGLLGKASECGETIDEMMNAIVEQRPINTLKMGVEVGDALWYDAVTLDELGLPFEEVLDAVVRKLKVRYAAGKFDPVEATNRDLEAEQEAIEAKV